MNFRSLSIFITVCEERSMTAAARRLHLAQPSVSMAIRDLEAEYDCVFFERLSKRLYLTEAGQQFYDYAQRMRSIQEEMDACFHARTYARQLRIGSSITIASTVLFPLLHQFNQERPALQLQTKVLSTYAVEEFFFFFFSIFLFVYVQTSWRSSARQIIRWPTKKRSSSMCFRICPFSPEKKTAPPAASPRACSPCIT